MAIKSSLNSDIIFIRLCYIIIPSQSSLFAYFVDLFNDADLFSDVI